MLVSDGFGKAADLGSAAHYKLVILDIKIQIIHKIMIGRERNRSTKMK